MSEGIEWFPETKADSTDPPSSGKYQQSSMALGFLS
jgi:hypothetical protein